MLIRFNEGPWDGVQFEADFAPLTIQFRDLEVGFEKISVENVEKMHSSERVDIQYNLQGRKLPEGVEPPVCEGQDPLDIVHEDQIVMDYRHARGEKALWED